MTSAEIFAWLDTDEGLAWSRSQPERRFYEDTYPGEMVQQGPGNSDEDPTGRPPIAGKGAAREEGAA
jgi:hypothetical protein